MIIKKEISGGSSTTSKPGPVIPETVSVNKKFKFGDVSVHVWVRGEFMGARSVSTHVNL